MALALPHRPHVADPRARHEQPDLRVALAERAQPRDLRGHLVPQALAADHRVDRLGADAGARTERARCVLPELRAEALQVAVLDLEPGGGAVAAVAREGAGAGMERRQEVETRNAAAGAATSSFVVERDQHRRPKEALGQ